MDNLDVDPSMDQDRLRTFAGEVKKRLEEEKEKEEEDKFLRSSLRGSNRLKAIENYRKLIRQGTLDQSEVNEAFEHDEVIPSESELAELINYLKTKIPPDQHDDETKQWKWLLGVLCDPLVSKAFLMHDRVAVAYERCARAHEGQPRSDWPILPGASSDVLTGVKELVLAMLKTSVISDMATINQMSQLYALLNNPRIRTLCVAMDGLANTWMFDVEPERAESQEDLAEDEEYSTATLGKALDTSVVPGCYSTLAYDDLGHDSFSEQGVRLKYVVFQKHGNEFLGATVTVSGRSILVARIVNGGLAQKTGLLHEGDELLAANGVELLGKDLNTATNILASLQGQVVLLVAPTAEQTNKAQPGGILHIRALFSYEPIEDRQLACQELGLPFSKGDILHVTDRSDPDWWQAYRNDEETGITGAVGTLAGLIPSPIFQRRRSILRLRSLHNTNPKEVEWEDEPSDLETGGTSSCITSEKPTKRFPGIRLPFGGKKAKENEYINPTLTDSIADVSQSGTDTPDPSAAIVNSGLVSSIYADRMSTHSPQVNVQPSEEAIEEWSAAGPVWGQHGFEMRQHRTRGGSRKRFTRSSFPCWKSMHGEKPSYAVVGRFPSLNPGPDPNLINSTQDPLAWLDREIRTGYLPHPSLWIYEPVTQYVPQPLRRRPLVFVGPAHVGRHQLMQRLIQLDTTRFCSVPIVTTNQKIKSDSVINYKIVSEEEFEADRKRGEFIEYGVFNRARYGTSCSKVRELIDSGNVCCISLRPDSLRKLRSSGLMAYVIFISPPERVDELRRIQKLLGLKANCSDLELIACIEASRKMEVKYGHWFDVAVTPDSMDATVAVLENIATRLEREPSWVPRYWLRPNPLPS